MWIFFFVLDFLISCLQGRLTNIFLSINFKISDDIILKYFATNVYVTVRSSHELKEVIQEKITRLKKAKK